MSYEQTIRKMRRELMECEAERVQRVKEFEEQRQELIYRKNRLYELAHDTEYASYRVRETAPDEFSRLHRDIDSLFSATDEQFRRRYRAIDEAEETYLKDSRKKQTDLETEIWRLGRINGSI
ncbi:MULTISPECIES: hypothetical protein [Streptococcus anginosus group]|jgi:hypothetical protein|uniref:hypothetical protein n=1 Tax=Streptococcus anginosus group TaxID=671232 RepID=UPI000E3C1E46|nr:MULTISPECIES: hypothetical protein [Streptococcus anginosus group]RSJ12441.1 hypothetical protein D8832_07910 [Streptococcus intermedius]